MTVKTYLDRCLNDLQNRTCATPMDILGRHTLSESQQPGCQSIIRCFSPSTQYVQVCNFQTGEEWGVMERIGDTDLFEFHCATGEQQCDVYGLRITCSSGHPCYRADPYQFGCYTLKQDAVEPFALYRHLGSHIHNHILPNGTKLTGTLFRVYAPYARAVSIVGNFNHWDGRCHPMASADDGIWRLFMPGIHQGNLYKYEIRDHAGQSTLKTDPFGYYMEQAPGHTTLVYDHNQYLWHDHPWVSKQTHEDVHSTRRPLSIYEAHAGSWRHRHDQQAEGRPLSYRELAEELIPYVVDMGFTHIELLPLLEHPFTASWGYQPTGLFAPTSRYGTPDDFKYFVDQCHQHGLGVILDWVPAHFPADSHGQSCFDGTPLFEYSDPLQGWHPDWHTHIYDYRKSFVRHFLISNACYWLDLFHLDGLRVDAVASLLYLDYSREPGQWRPNADGSNINREAVSFLQELNSALYKHFPHCMVFAEESTSWNGVTQSVDHGGLGFGYKWNLGWMHDTLQYMQKDPIHRQHHHNELTFSLLYAYSENFVLPLSHDEVVHGKGSLLRRMPGDEWQRFAGLRAMFGYMYGHPGKKLLFMGSELGSWNEWYHGTELDWWLLDAGPYHKGLQKLVRDLNNCYCEIKALYQQDHQPEGFHWLVVNDHSQSVYAFLRTDAEDRSQMIIVCNMTPVVRHNYRFGAPTGRWQEVLNTDADTYAGSGVTNPGLLPTEEVASHDWSQSLRLTLPPLSTIFLLKAES